MDIGGTAKRTYTTAKQGIRNHLMLSILALGIIVYLVMRRK